jgi:hypothetical protein
MRRGDKGEGATQSEALQLPEAPRRFDGYAQKTAREDPGRAPGSAERRPEVRGTGLTTSRRAAGAHRRLSGGSGAVGHKQKRKTAVSELRDSPSSQRQSAEGVVREGP